MRGGRIRGVRGSGSWARIGIGSDQVRERLPYGVGDRSNAVEGNRGGVSPIIATRVAEASSFSPPRPFTASPRLYVSLPPSFPLGVDVFAGSVEPALRGGGGEEFLSLFRAHLGLIRLGARDENLPLVLLRLRLGQRRDELLRPFVGSAAIHASMAPTRVVGRKPPRRAPGRTAAAGVSAAFAASTSAAFASAASASAALPRSLGLGVCLSGGLRVSLSLSLGLRLRLGGLGVRLSLGGGLDARLALASAP